MEMCRKMAKDNNGVIFSGTIEGKVKLKMIWISRNLALDDNDVEEEFVLASGPGGQNLNRRATSVQLRCKLRDTVSLPDDIKARLLKKLGNQLTADGELIIEAKRYRTQKRNREDAVERLREILREALKTPKKRRPTRPGKAAKAKRMDAKTKLSQKKQLRGKISRDD